MANEVYAPIFDQYGGKYGSTTYVNEPADPMQFWKSNEEGPPSPGRTMVPINAGLPRYASSVVQAPSQGAVQGPPTPEASKAGEVLGAVSGISAMLPGIGSIISGVTGVGALIMNWWAAGEQMKENKKAQAAQQKAYDDAQVEDRRRYDAEAGYRQQVFDEQKKRYLQDSSAERQQTAFSQNLQTEQLGMAKEDQQWGRYLQLTANMTSMMSSPNQRAGLAQNYARKAA